MRRRLSTALLTWAFAVPLLAQTPLPFPGAAVPPAEAPRSPRATPAQQPAAPTPAQTPAPVATAVNANGSPALVGGFPVYPSSQLLGSYDAGKGQRYYLYGTTIGYEDVVAFYRSELKDRGDEVFSDPPTHMFAVKFREETMVFPPGVTVKDWTHGSQGYPNPHAGGKPERFPTVVMIVTPPPAAPAPAAR
jgi:hypothetical protein